MSYVPSASNPYGLLRPQKRRDRPSDSSQHFRTGDLISWNGWHGKVSGRTNKGLIRVSFGQGRIRELPESALTVFVPWWSDRD